MSDKKYVYFWRVSRKTIEYFGAIDDIPRIRTLDDYRSVVRSIQSACVEQHGGCSSDWAILNLNIL